MDICYYALRAFDEYRPGDLIPNAANWPFVQGYVSEGKIAPVLVCTLPDDLQDALEEWESSESHAATYIGERDEPEPVEVPATEDDDEQFDPGDFTVDEVIAYVEANPDEADAILEAEAAGKNRSTLIAALTDDSDDE